MPCLVALLFLKTRNYGKKLVMKVIGGGKVCLTQSHSLF